MNHRTLLAGGALTLLACGDPAGVPENTRSEPVSADQVERRTAEAAPTVPWPRIIRS